MDPEEIQRIFLINLRESIKTVMFLTEYCVLHGCKVELEGMKFADNYKDRMDFVDQGHDMVIKGKTFNAKQNSRTFSSVKEFADEYRHYPRPILVSAIHVKNTPDYYCILSADRKGAILIPKESKVYWGKRENVYDPRYKTTQTCFDVSEEHVIWWNLTD